MPTPGLRAEYPTQFGALDDDAARAAISGDAHVLRELARNANYLAGLGNPLLNLCWNASPDTGDDIVQGGMVDWVTFPDWRRLIMGPAPVKRKPSILYGEVQGWASVTNGQRLWIQIGTDALPFNPQAQLTAPNVIAITGTGSMANFSATHIPLGRGEFDMVDIFVTGDPTEDLMSAGYGTQAGTITGMGMDWIVDSGATFNASLNAVSASLTLVILDSAGAIVAQRGVAGVHPASTDTLYTVQPLFTAQECVRFLGLDYEIRQRCGYRFESLVLHEMNAWEY